MDLRSLPPFAFGNALSNRCSLQLNLDAAGFTPLMHVKPANTRHRMGSTQKIAQQMEQWQADVIKQEQTVQQLLKALRDDLDSIMPSGLS